MDDEDGGGRGSGDRDGGGEVKNKGLRCVNTDVCFVAGAGRPGGGCGDTVLRANSVETRLRRFRAGGGGSETWQIGSDGGRAELC